MRLPEKTLIKGWVPVQRILHLVAETSMDDILLDLDGRRLVQDCVATTRADLEAWTVRALGSPRSDGGETSVER